MPILDVAGVRKGAVVVTLLPDSYGSPTVAPLIDCSGEPSADPTLPAVQLLEGQEYRYEFDLPQEPGEAVRTDKPEVFERDTTSGRSGRIRPGLYTGTLTVAVEVAGSAIGHATVEVRSRKLDYLTHFRWMLRDIADESAEVIMERFAPAEQRFAIDESADAATLYQRFAFLRSLLVDDSLDSAIRQILTRPYVTWEEEHEIRAVSQGIRGSSALSRQVMRAGVRVPRPAWLGLAIESIPKSLITTRTDTSLDNIPNRFLRFALTRWRDVLLAIRQALQGLGGGPTVTRGLSEIAVVLDHLQGLLGEELFREVGPLTTFPAGNQVLQRREGYRDVLRAYLQFELAAKLAWKGGEDVYRAGQRDVAALYEYWTFMQLARVIAQLCKRSFDLSSLIEVDESGLGLALRRGRATIVQGVTSRFGRDLSLDLWFNRGFRKPGGSWSLDMRPDCSLEIRPVDSGELLSFEPIWVHFDAKYRINLVNLEALAADSIDEAQVAVGNAKREDLLKMHAYRDAIRRSAGAYVLYPGTRNDMPPLAEYHELLPGLGAFALRPVDSGAPIGTSALTAFLSDVLDHVATQISQHERGRYWRRRVYDQPQRPSLAAPLAPFLPRPAADTRVLLGFVRGQRHLDWIHKTRLYNLRADARRGRVGLESSELSADLVVLYGQDGLAPEVWGVQGLPELHTKAEMEELGYPEPQGGAYYCIPLREVEAGDWENVIVPEMITRLRSTVAPEAPYGAPVATTWLRLAEFVWRNQ